MSSINLQTREITCKVVYYGPGLSGKTTNLQVVHQKIPLQKRTEMVSLATDTDRTLFFDFLPLDLGNIKGFKTKFQLYTVPGQVYYNSTRKMVLRGVDGVVFVADSSKDRLAENLESLQNLQQNLREYGMKLENLPFVLQYNKRDLPNIFTMQEMNEKFNFLNVEAYPAAAYQAKGVITTLKAISRKVIEDFNRRQSGVSPKADSATRARAMATNGNTIVPPAQPAPAATKAPETASPVIQSTAPEMPKAPSQPESTSGFTLESSNPYDQTSPATVSTPSAAPNLDAGPAGAKSPTPPAEEKKDEGLFVDGIELKPYVPKKKKEGS